MKMILLITMTLFFQACSTEEVVDHNTNNIIQALKMVSIMPSNGEEKVSNELNEIKIKFSRSLDQNSINEQTVLISPILNGTLSSNDTEIIFTPNETHKRGVNYKITLKNIRAEDGGKLLVNTSDNINIYSFFTCEVSANTVFHLQWDAVQESDLLTYRVYYSQESPLTKENAIGYIDTESSELNISAVEIGVLPCTSLSMAVSALGRVKKESFLSIQITKDIN